MSEFSGIKYDDDEYRIINVGAHRKPAPLFGAPGLSLHYAMWMPPGLDVNTWHRNIDYFLYLLYMTVTTNQSDAVKKQNKFVSPNFDVGRSTLFLFRNSVGIDLHSDSWRWNVTNLIQIQVKDQNIRYDVFSLRGIFMDLPLTVRAELHGEYWTITFLCDLDTLNTARDNFAQTRPGQISDQFHKIYNHALSRFKARNDSNVDVSSTTDGINHFGDLRELLHGKFRKFVAEEIMNPCNQGSPPKPSDIKPDNLGRIFAEFHGCILGAVCAKGAEDFEPLLPGCNFHKNTIPQQIGFSYFSKESSINIVDAFWPVIRALHHRRDENFYGKPEFTVTRFQNKRAIYVSSLGQFNPDTSHPEYTPVLYTIIVAYKSRWQLGRFIERFHNLGTLRLAAIREIAKIQIAGDKLSAIQDEINQAKSQNTDEKLSDLVTSLNMIGSDIKYGLQSRVDRSKYYVRAFEQILDTMRPSRIEGFQPYKQFVRRRMYGTFDYIERVGRRYEEVRREIELLLERSRTEKLLEVQQNISKIADETSQATGASLAVARNLRERAETTNHLLSNAEKIIALPLAYYFGNILFEAGVFLEKILTNTNGFIESYKVFAYVTSFAGTLLFIKLLKIRKIKTEEK